MVEQEPVMWQAVSITRGNREYQTAWSEHSLAGSLLSCQPLYLNGSSPISEYVAAQYQGMNLFSLHKLSMLKRSISKTAGIVVLLLLFANPAAIAGEADLLFQSDELLSFTLSGPINKLDKERESGTVYQPAFLTYKDSQGQSISLNVRLRPRGKKRLSRVVCSFPPIRILFDKQETANTIFAKQKKLKLVTQCQPELKRHEYYLLTEYLAYKTLNLLTNDSYKVRLVRVSYVDNTIAGNKGNGKALHTNFGFLIEPTKRLAKRINRTRFKPPETSATHLDGTHLNLVSLFQMMIGNTDWSATHGGVEECCHNGKLFGEAESSDNLFIPYDFDMTGLVNPDYATVDKALKLDSIRDRRYRGYCRNLEWLDYNIILLNLKRREILTLFEHAPYLPDRRNRVNLRYMEGFYRLINNPKRVKRKIYARCHKSYMIDKADTGS